MEALGQTGSYREHHGMMPLAVRCPAPLDTPWTLTVQGVEEVGLFPILPHHW